jgi:polyisoprenoid-binding protein YceI
MNTRNFKNKALLLAAAIVLPISFMSFTSSPVPEAIGPAFSLKTESSTVSWKGTKPGGAHYGVIQVVNGNINTDGEMITGGDFTIDMNTIICEDLTNEGMNNRLVGHLKSEDFFHTEKYPKAFFKITDVTKQMSAKDGFTATHRVTGNLTVRGNTEEITFPANIKMEGDKVYAKTGEIMLDRTKWDVNFQSKKIFANLKDSYIDDNMIVSLDLKFDVN